MSGFSAMGGWKLPAELEMLRDTVRSFIASSESFVIASTAKQS
jgi:hypothetical protein